MRIHNEKLDLLDIHIEIKEISEKITLPEDVGKYKEGDIIRWNVVNMDDEVVRIIEMKVYLVEYNEHMDFDDVHAEVIKIENLTDWRKQADEEWQIRC